MYLNAVLALLLINYLYFIELNVLNVMHQHSRKKNARKEKSCNFDIKATVILLNGKHG